MNDRAWSSIAFVLFFSLFFYGNLTGSGVTEYPYAKAQDGDISIFDLEAGSQTDSSALDVFASFLTGGFEFETGTLYLAYPSVYSGMPGTSVTLFGGGFSRSENNVFFGPQAIHGVDSPTGTTLTFTVPQVSFGEYNVFVSTGGVVTDSFSFSVLDLGHPPPTISSIAPSLITGSALVTIYGSGFSTTTGNTIMTGYDIRENVISPDGRTLTVSIQPPDTAVGDTSLAEYGTETVLFEEQMGNSAPEELWIYVVNENGFSNPAIYHYSYDEASL